MVVVNELSVEKLWSNGSSIFFSKDSFGFFCTCLTAKIVEQSGAINGPFFSPH